MLRIDGHLSPVYSLAFSPDSSLLASGGKGGGVRVWDATGAQRWLTAPGGCSPRHTLAWSPDAERVFTGEKNSLYAVHRDGDRGHEAGTMPVGEVCAVAFIGPSLLAVGTGRRHDTGPGRLHLWDVAARREKKLPAFIGGFHGVRSLAAHPPSKTLHWVCGVSNSTACLWRSWPITSPDSTDVSLGKPASALAVSDSGDLVAIAIDWTVRLYPTAGRGAFAELTGHKGKVGGLAFLHGGRTLATASWDETVRFWDVATGKETARFPVGVGKLTALAASPDGTRVAVGGTDGPIVLLDTE